MFNEKTNNEIHLLHLHYQEITQKYTQQEELDEEGIDLKQAEEEHFEEKE
jgi:hypothetical protein